MNDTREPASSASGAAGKGPGSGPPPSSLPHPAFRADRATAVPRIDPAALQSLLSSDEPPVLLDVRSPDQRVIAHLPGDLWIPLELIMDRRAELPREGPIVVYCHHGGAASRAADLLRESGRVDVAVLEGGIDDYARLVDPTIPRYREAPSERLVLQQFPNLRTGCLAYLLRDRFSDEAVIVDPGREIAPYLKAVSDQRLRLRAIVETHTHADHLSGHSALHARTGAPIWLSLRSTAQYPHRTLVEDQAVDFGGSELVVMETPGHTDDHLSLRIDDVVFTGDTLLPGSCGRTDLGTGDPDALWQSLTTKLLALPDETEMFPAHYGPLHGLPPPERYSSTIGFERRTNEALQQPTREAFRTYMTEGWPPVPAEFERIVLTNLRE